MIDKEKKEEDYEYADEHEREFTEWLIRQLKENPCGTGRMKLFSSRAQVAQMEKEKSSSVNCEK